jgi:nucleotide-binding universal stress UspA family protein
MYKHILLPTDGSDRSERAIAAGIALAKVLNATVTGLFVSEATYIPGVDERPHPQAQAALSVISQLADKAAVTAVCIDVPGDSPQETIIRIAKERGCDLIVMGTHGRSKLGKFILGSVAGALLADCEIPVLLYR